MPVTVVKIETEKEIFDRHDKEAKDSAKAAILPGHVMMQVTHGPYGGRRMQIPENEAGRAESDGWAYKQGDTVLDIPERDELSPEETFDVIQKANLAAERIREPDEDGRKKREKEQRERRDMEAADESDRQRQRREMEADRPDSHKYQTRDIKPQKR